MSAPSWQTDGKVATTAASLVRAVGKQHDAYRANQQVHVQPGRPVANVVGVELHTLVVGRVVTARHLPEPRDTRCDHRVETVVRPILLDLRGDDRPRADQAHFAADHVPDLRQLVEARLAGETSHSGPARVVAELVILLP